MKLFVCLCVVVVACACWLHCLRACLFGWSVVSSFGVCCVFVCLSVAVLVKWRACLTVRLYIYACLFAYLRSCSPVRPFGCAFIVCIVCLVVRVCVAPLSVCQSACLFVVFVCVVRFLACLFD